jgi:hypothetical protein
MTANITTTTELFHRFHACQLYVKQGEIAACLIAFKQIIESLKAVPILSSSQPIIKITKNNL